MTSYQEYLELIQSNDSLSDLTYDLYLENRTPKLESDE